MNIYIDESGSMTQDSVTKNNKFFIIALLLVEDPHALKKVYKRFISKNLSVLENIDKSNKMFSGKKFLELKGSALTPSMKRSFVNYFCKNNHFKILYINIDNTLVDKSFYNNKARAFNYVLKLAIDYLSNIGGLVDRDWVLNIDERNVKTDTKYLLKEYLITEFSTGKNIVDRIDLSYFDSCNSKLIQLADVFANLMYSNILTDGCYNSEINYMIENKYIIDIFKFPLSNE